MNEEVGDRDAVLCPSVQYYIFQIELGSSEYLLIKLILSMQARIARARVRERVLMNDKI